MLQTGHAFDGGGALFSDRFWLADRRLVSGVSSSAVLSDKVCHSEVRSPSQNSEQSTLAATSTTSWVGVLLGVALDPGIQVGLGCVPKSG